MLEISSSACLSDSSYLLAESIVVISWRGLVAAPVSWWGLVVAPISWWGLVAAPIYWLQLLSPGRSSLLVGVGSSSSGKLRLASR